VSKQRAIIIGAGPAGLTAAYELATRTEIEPVVLEQDDIVGGISRTVKFQGNRIDIGGHRFFSKSDRVMQWWFKMLPLQKCDEKMAASMSESILRGLADPKQGPDPAVEDQVMLIRPRKSRIYYSRKFFDYPISLSKNTVTNLGLIRMGRIGMSYMKACAMPIKPEDTLEQFLINRFGRELYETFFRSYTEKVWGVPCNEISAEWGAQRIKGLNVWKALANAFSSVLGRSNRKGVETSLIEQFYYPKLGPGQMWETTACRVEELGGSVMKNKSVCHLQTEGNRVTGVVAKDRHTGEETVIKGDYFFSTMPIKQLIRSLDANVPDAVREISDGLVYRDFITVGLLLDEMKIRERAYPSMKMPTDNWIYIQEPDVQVGRLQIFNNWSPYMVADPSTVWVGLEYFCNEGDRLWSLSDEAMSQLAVEEMVKIGMIEAGKVRGSTVIRIPKTYPAYFGSYPRFDEMRSWVDQYPNLFLVGRNGMHKYNNQDHSMLTAMTAVDNIIEGRTDHDNIWEVNAERTYHEEKK
jgi:protoporphyrinogen oxidase